MIELIPPENLESFGRKLRKDAEPYFSEATISPGYTFDKNNPANGQCGIMSVAGAERFTWLATVLTGNEMKKQRLEELASSGQKDLKFHQRAVEFVGTFLALDEQFRANTVGMVGKVAVCDYGATYYREYNEDGTLKYEQMLSDDHCWFRAVDLHEIFCADKTGYDTTAGQVVDTTLDQFSTPERPLPAIRVQRANDLTGPYRYEAVPKASALVGLHGTDERLFKERHMRLTEAMRVDFSSIMPDSVEESLQLLYRLNAESYKKSPWRPI